MTWKQILAVVGVGSLLALALASLFGSGTVSGCVVGGAVVLLCLYDLWTYLVRGNDKTISVRLWNLAKRNLGFALCVAFILGVLVGHMFLPQHVQGAPVPTHLFPKPQPPAEPCPVGTRFFWPATARPGQPTWDCVVVAIEYPVCVIGEKVYCPKVYKVYGLGWHQEQVWDESEAQVRAEVAAWHERLRERP